MIETLTNFHLVPFTAKLQACETLSPEGTVITRAKRVDPKRETPNYMIARTAAGTYIAYGVGLPIGVEDKSLTRIRKICDLMAYEYTLQ